jgi:hypothetical protein
MTAKYFHTVLTNVPGPVDKIQWAGEEVDEIVATIPQPGHPNSLGASIYTYSGKVTLSVVGCRDDESKLWRNGNMQEICECFEDSLRAMSGE